MDESKQPILNIDDYLPARYARTKILKQAGFTVVEASTGAEGLKAVAEFKPSIVLLDVNLPDMTGFEVCEKIRNDPETASITIIHVSASSVESRHLVTGLEGGADGYLVEPLEPSVLIATINAFIRARRAEEALRRSNAELEAFAHRAAHDLNEPLRAILIHAERVNLHLKNGSISNVDESMRFVLDSAQRLSALVDGLLRFAQATIPDFATTSVDCEAVFTNVVSDLDVAICESGAVITHDPLPVIIAGSEIQQVLQNLIGNAIKYRANDVVPQIHVSARPESSMWLFSVRDNGIGIEPRFRVEIFRSFSRLHGREIPGNGLGLAVCKRVVEAHGGAIWIESQFGSGSTFHFTIPRKAPTRNTFK